jgi:DNA-binding NarL/FixJ family response regulator
MGATPVQAIVFQIPGDGVEDLIDHAARAHGITPKVRVFVVISSIRHSLVLAEILDTWVGTSRRRPKSAKLTRRQEQVLIGIRAGHTNRQIAHDLELSVSTINRYVEQILQRLHVHNRAQAAGLGMRSDS